MANWGKAFQGLARGFREGKGLEEEQKRTKIAEQEQLRREEEMHLSKQAAAEERSLKLIQLRLAEETHNLNVLKEKNESSKMGLTVLESMMGEEGITPIQKDKMVKSFQDNYQMDITPYFKENKNEKTGVVNTYNLENTKSIKDKLDQQNKEYDLKLKKAQIGNETLQNQINLKKLQQGDIPKTAVEAVVEAVYKEPGFDKLSADQKIQKISDGMWKLPTSATVTKSPLEPGATKNIQMELAGMAESIGLMQDIKKNFNKEFFEYTGKGKKFVLDKVIKGGGEISPENRKFIEQGRSLVNAANRMFNKYVTDISGAQFSIKEMERYKDSFMNMDMNSIEFEQTYNDFVKYMQKSYRLKSMLLKQGVTDDKEIGKQIDNLLFSKDDPTLSPEARTARGSELKQIGAGKFKTQKELMDFVDDQLIKEGYF